MRCGLFTLLSLAATVKAGDYSGPLRPQVQFSPPEGFMNDPNGLFYDGKRGTYHYYYQYNPFAPVPANQHWGHATSPDLYHWTNHPPAIKPDHEETIFSGSVVIDSENTSGFFPNQDDGVVAIYTAHSPTKETQHIAYSVDGGYTFTKYSNNPVIDSHTDDLRDPKVIWHAESQKWVLFVAWAHTREIGIYASPNLRDWSLMSNYTQEGLPGTEFECPNLLTFTVDDEVSGRSQKDVMVISVNPGAPLGGSGTFYVVGQFNGSHFNSEVEKATLYNFSKDNYASQWFYGLPKDSKPVSIGWASNWDYTRNVPSGDSEGWRGATTLPREHTLINVDGAWRLTQTPFQDLLPVKDVQLVKNTFRKGEMTVDFSNVESNAVYFDVTIDNLPSADIVGKLSFNFTSTSGEYLDGAVELDTGLFWINRAGTHLFTAAENTDFTGQFSTSISVSEAGQFNFSGIIDRSVFEVFLEGGRQSGTMSFYPTRPLNKITFAATGLGGNVTVDVELWGLKSGWSS